MKTLVEVVKPLLNEHGTVHWKVGIVLAIDAPNHNLTVQFVGAAAGAGTPNVGYVDSYTPHVNDIVHAMSSEERGILVLGSTGSAPPAVMAASALMDEPVPPDVTSDPMRSGTFTSGGSQFSPREMRQGPGYLGVWAFDNLATVIQDAQAVGIITSLEIELILYSGGPGAVLALIGDRGGRPNVALPEYWTPALVPGVPTRIAVPIGWLSPLAGGSTTIGLSNKPLVPEALLDPVASLYVTVQPV